MGLFDGVLKKVIGGPVGLDGMEAALKDFKNSNRLNTEEYESLRNAVFNSTQYKPEEIHSHQINYYLNKIYRELKGWSND